MSSPSSPSRSPSRHSRLRSDSQTSGGRSASIHQHAPLNPSHLRKSHTPPASSYGDDAIESGERSKFEVEPMSPLRLNSRVDDDGVHPPGSDRVEAVGGENANTGGEINTEVDVDARTKLLESYDRGHACGNKICNHGTFSPRPQSPLSLGDFTPRFDYGSIGGRDVESVSDETQGLLDGDSNGGGSRDALKAAPGQLLLRRTGMKTSKRMYLSYYFPFANWIQQYKWSYLKGDLVAALTMASFYIPMALSYASNLGHVPPINGLYAFVFNPFIYALLGSCPQMVVGPEAAGSLLTGSVIHESDPTDEDMVLHARIAGVVTGMAGGIIFIAGLFRLGFLDNVLSRPFLRGFISAIGFVILVDQLIPEMGLSRLAKDVSHGSTVEKLMFLIRNVGNAHGLTCGMAFGSFTIIMFFRELKKRLQPRFPNVAFIPDRFLVVVLSTILTWKLNLDEKGVHVLGDVRSGSGGTFTFHFPFVPSHMKHVREAMGTSFLIALLGFFESSVAAKALGGADGRDGIQGVNLSPNRELVALGTANIIGGCFMAMPAFGGYGRSKVNASTGGKTPMSSLFLSLISVICVLFLLPSFYYLPVSSFSPMFAVVADLCQKSVLSAMISVVAYSLVEECPHDIKFFIRIGGWSDLGLMFLVFAATIFYSLPFGIALGMGLSILNVIRHSTKPRIQILGKVPGTTTQFQNAEDDPDKIEFIEGCLIVKIPEPLTFANTGDLKSRLRRLEMYGTTTAHPALPRLRAEEHNRNIIFDVHGVTSLDGSGTQVLKEIVDSYVERNVRVFFCRVPKENTPVFQRFVNSGIVEKCGGMRYFVKSVDEALRMTEVEDLENMSLMSTLRS
ncbi:MAG: hypothetical protein M1834_008635 [Cirrosporium novae-zelandiae]|nr:MAG: hypothetical protein M1834_008635 [Cirrosporium novae-zelandiae]